MSKILDLAQNFEAKSKEQASNTEQHLKSEFERHERFVVEALKSSEQQIESAIHVQNRRMSALMLKSWSWITLSIILVLGGIQAVLWWQGTQIRDNWQTIQAQKETLKTLHAQTWGIQLQQGKEGRFIILPPKTRAETGWTIREQNAIRLEKY